MYLQHRIKISKENANNLIATINKRDYLWEIQNNNFLREDLESLKESYHNRKNKTESEIEPVMKDLGNFVSPDYGIILRYLYEEYSKYPEAGKTQDLLFSCGPFANGLPIIPCIAFYVINKDSRKIQLFNQCFCEQNIRQKDLMADKIIFELASFFAISGISNAPGTQNVSMSSSAISCLISASIAPPNNFDEINSLNLETIIPTFISLSTKFPS